MAKISKKDRARRLIAENSGLFQCPICRGPAEIDGYSLRCSTSHTFDLARKGYLNLLVSGKAPVYEQELFQARQQISSAGFFDPLIDKLVGIIRVYHSSANLDLRILDAGCGEGSHLYRLVNKLDRQAVCIGADIAKSAINLAANHSADILWCVADLAGLPLQDRSISVILNILAPANYGEFARILHDGGIVIKVVPGPDYLKELRSSGSAETYSNQRVIEHFQEEAVLLEQHRVSYEFEIAQKLWPHLVGMTPLTWSQDQEKLLEAVQDQNRVTGDFTVLVGSFCP